MAQFPPDSHCATASQFRPGAAAALPMNRPLPATETQAAATIPSEGSRLGALCLPRDTVVALCLLRDTLTPFPGHQKGAEGLGVGRADIPSHAHGNRSRLVLFQRR